MTDGIIQKVFTSWDKRLTEQYQYFFRADFPIITEIEKLKQELIEEIKKLFPDSPFRHSNAFIISRLIGDNEK